MSRGSDPRRIIDDAPLSRLQLVAIAIAVGLNALDGFDVLSISFAAPGIAKEWNIDRAALGVVLSMELIGMAVGSVLFGGIADRIGRRKTILTCLVVMAFGMAMVPWASGIFQLSCWRVLTGLGIGGMLAATAAITAEFANRKRRNLALAIMTIGYPIGAVIGGMISAVLLAHYDWRAVFVFGAAVTICFLPLVLFLVPEPVHFLLVRRDGGTLDRVNRLMRRMGHQPVAELPPVTRDEEKSSIADILKPGLLATTLLVTTAYFMHIVTFYFILKWAPKIVVDMGYVPADAAGVLVWANIGGALGGGIFGLLSQRFPLRGMTMLVLLASFGMVTLFGAVGVTTLQGLSLLAFAAGLFTNSGVVGLYTIFAHAFPTHARGTGTGFAIGVGRGGAALSPILAGVLFQAGFALPVVAAALGAGSLVAALALMGVKLRNGDGSKHA
ncbi:MFS transporter [Sphingobium jiangsuense]|uniref:Benzoate transport n=1 Tax=Sphingobium jiangsuense TaxID=870476 RepID=A0A7W6BPN3_9SPHN|nr:MFS transporter [Sphingobium jiangsuense]MBB3925554.1 benzoate transport [Sphingobium jiangsuense]GLS99854.1 MFS transporter [Sphingobium jiangsuense]